MAQSGTVGGTNGAPTYVRIEDAAIPGQVATVSASGALSVNSSGDTATNADALAVTATATKAQSVGLGYVFNGSTFDRRRGMSAVADGLGVALGTQPSSTYSWQTATAATASVIFAPVVGQVHRLTFFSAAYANSPVSASTVQWVDGGSTDPLWTAGAVAVPTVLPPGGIKSASANQQLGIQLPSGGAAVVGNVLVAKLTA